MQLNYYCFYPAESQMFLFNEPNSITVCGETWRRRDGVQRANVRTYDLHGHISCKKDFTETMCCE